MTPELNNEDGNKMYAPDYFFLALHVLQAALLLGILVKL